MLCGSLTLQLNQYLWMLDSPANSAARLGAVDLHVPFGSKRTWLSPPRPAVWTLMASTRVRQPPTRWRPQA